MGGGKSKEVEPVTKFKSSLKLVARSVGGSLIPYSYTFKNTLHFFIDKIDASFAAEI